MWEFSNHFTISNDVCFVGLLIDELNQDDLFESNRMLEFAFLSLVEVKTHTLVKNQTTGLVRHLIQVSSSLIR